MVTDETIVTPTQLRAMMDQLASNQAIPGRVSLGPDWNTAHSSRVERVRNGDLMISLDGSGSAYSFCGMDNESIAAEYAMESDRFEFEMSMVDADEIIDVVVVVNLPTDPMRMPTVAIDDKGDDLRLPANQTELEICEMAVAMVASEN